jgi:hypothetical protein
VRKKQDDSHCCRRESRSCKKKLVPPHPGDCFLLLCFFAQLRSLYGNTSTTEDLVRVLLLPRPLCFGRKAIRLVLDFGNLVVGINRFGSVVFHELVLAIACNFLW